eukprot:4310071-Prymnesium_polylepis.2
MRVGPQCDSRDSSWVDAPSKGTYGEMQREESDANQKSYEDAGLLKLLFDEQHPTGQRQFAAHLQRFPPKCRDLIIAREESCCTAQWRRDACS